MSARAPNILIVEDQGMFREFILAKCRGLFPTAAIRACGNGAQAKINSAVSAPSLALLDVNLPDMDGLELGQQLMALYPNLRVLCLSAECSEALLIRLKATKISGFVDKNDPIDVIEVAITEVLSGHNYYSSSLRAQQLGLSREANAWPKLLSDMEIKILPYLGANLEFPHIAAIFHISENTILWHRKNIRSKLDLRSDSDLMHFCATKGFVLVGGGQVRPVKMSSLSGTPARLPAPVFGEGGGRATEPRVGRIAGRS